MRLDWIDDILAVLDEGSISAAAAKRNISQPAFSRRLRTMEEALGLTLFDRNVRPAIALHSVAQLAPRLRDASHAMRQVRLDLRIAAGYQDANIVIAAQHSLTMSLAAQLVERLDWPNRPGGLRLRSANRDDCVAMLQSGDADFALAHRTPGEVIVGRPNAFEIYVISVEPLLPVAGQHEAERIKTGELRLIGYPGDVFLGQVFAAEIAPRLPDSIKLRSRAETAHTPAALQLVLAEAGTAWLPRGVVADDLRSGRLVSLEQHLPTAMLEICALRRLSHQNISLDHAWREIARRHEA